MSKHHQELTNGIGKCSVPMWCNGMPAGFCDKPAYSEPIKEVGHWENGVFYKQYIPGLACREHGGSDTPEDVVVELDGNERCAHFTNFINLQESPAEFSKDKDEAILKLLSCQAPPQSDAGAEFPPEQEVNEQYLKFDKGLTKEANEANALNLGYNQARSECIAVHQKLMSEKEAEIEHYRRAIKRIIDIPNDTCLDENPCGQVDAMCDYGEEALKYKEKKK
jgi:hypothetical protein